MKAAWAGVVLMAAVLGPASGAGATTTSTTQPPNADQVTYSLVDNGQAEVAAAIVATTGMAGLGVVLLQRYLHKAVEAS